mmetsp:Transcript_17968/g.27029  ORF Transcript_17968/g.27029 Transcript_17968/m.27029 type:complete len:824 (-) Transcript_17968:506-2977(-)
MAFICKILGCGGSKDEIKDQSRPVVELERQKASATGNEMDYERNAFMSDSSGQRQDAPVPSPKKKEQQEPLLDPPLAGTREQEQKKEKERSIPTQKERSTSPTKKKKKVDKIHLPKEEVGSSVPARLKSPALPTQWQMIALQDDDEGKNVDLQVFGDEDICVEALEDPENDDADDPESGSFGDAWRSFKAQEQSGLTALRDYVGKNYIMLLRKMLCPDREHYATAALGPESFDFRGRRLRRDDFSVRNERGHLLQCSLWRDRPENNTPGLPEQNSTGTENTQGTPTHDNGPLRNFRRSLRGLVSGVLGRRERLYCVLYVHDVGGSRLAALSSLGVALDAGAAGYCALDSTACGRSEGRNISFGYFERYDIAAVCSYLISEAHFTDIVLWGRGAGAVACVLYAAGIDKPLPVPQSYVDSAYDAVFGSTPNINAGPSTVNNGHDQHTQQPRTSKFARLLGWPYEARHEISVNALAKLDRNALKNDQDQRLMTARRFAESLEFEPETSMWVASQPPLSVKSVKKNSEAAKLGIKVGDLLAGIGTSARLPHSQKEFVDMLERFARKPRATLMVHLLRGSLPSSTAPRTTLDTNQQRRLEPLVRPAGLILDCVVDSPVSLVGALRDDAARRESLLVNLLDPLLSSALNVLFHSVQKRANFAPSTIDLKCAARNIENVPALFGVNDFHDVDRGIPNLAGLSKVVFDAYGTAVSSLSSQQQNDQVDTTSGSPQNVTEPPPQKQIVKYNAPLRLALRGSLDAMSSKFLNKSYVFLQRLPGLRDHAASQRSAYFAQAGSSAPPRWVVTTRPWAQQETESMVDEYECAVDKVG